MGRLATAVGVAGTAAVLALLLAPTRLRAADLDLRVTAPGSGRVLAEKSVSLRPGEEVRFVRHGVVVPGGRGRFEVVLGVGLLGESDDTVTVSMHGLARLPGSATAPWTWAARSYTLARGEAATFAVYPEGVAGGVAFAVRHGGPAIAAFRSEVEGVRLTTVVRLRQDTSAGQRFLEERRVRLSGPEPTEVVLAGGGGGEAVLRLRLRPRSRGESGATVEIGVDSGAGTAAGRRLIREDVIDLGWDDAVEVEGLEGPGGPVVVEIRPER